MKKLLHYYSFDPANNTIVVEGIYRRERFLLITNVTTNQVIYTFNNATGGMAGYSINTSAETTTIVLDFDCSAMSSTDKLQIFIDQDFVNFEPSDTFVDPVSKIRVSEPSNLIDTDFEYGLQSTKWETLELVKNIPTIFARNGDADIPISTMDVTTGSDTVTVTTSENHGFLAGSPIIILGSKNVSCDGGFIVINVLSTTQFQYKAKRPLSFTGTVKDTYTQLFAGSLYSGTEFDIGGIEGISTDANTSTKLTVSTVYPTNFSLNTSFFMSNSKATVKVKIDSALVEPNNYIMVSNTITNNVATGENNSFSLVSVQPYRYTPANSNEVFFFFNNEISVASVNNSIIFPTPHGLIDNKPYVYFRGEENVGIGGLVDAYAYYVRVISPTQIYLSTISNTTSRISISQGQRGPSTRSAFIRAYGINRIYQFNDTYYNIFNFDEPHGLTLGASTPVMFFRSVNNVITNAYGGVLQSANFISQGYPYYPSTDATWISTVGSSTAMRFTGVPGTTGNLLREYSQAYNVGQGPVMVKMSALNTANSMFFDNISTLQTNDIVTFSAFQAGGIVPGGLANNTSYAIEKVTDNRIRFKDRNTGSIIGFSTIGSANALYRITANSTILDSDTVYLENNTLKDGSAVLYSNNSNVTIGGLTDQSTYYVFQKSQNRFKLSTTTEGWASGAKTITHSSAININNGYITLSIHGYPTQTAVQYTSSTPVNGLKNGGWYWIRSIDTNTFTLHFSKTGANNNTDLVQMVGPLSGTGSFRAANIVDLTSVSSGEQIFESSSPNAADGVYKLVEKIDDNTFLMESNNQIPLRNIDINPTKSVDLNRSAFYVPEHGLLPGTNTVYTTTGTPIGGLANGQNYFVSRISKDWFKLSSNLENALANVTLTLANNGTGVTHTLKTSTISGEILGTGRITLLANSTTIDGVGTNFPANYTSGDIIKIFETANVMTFNVSSIDIASDIITVAQNHGMATNDSFILSSGITPGGMTEDGIYYARVLTSTTLSAHPTPAAAFANTDRVNITSTGNTVTVGVIKTMGSTTEKEIETINGITRMELLEASNTTFSNVEYAIGTSLIIRADGSALHRPYDGGVELIPSTNPDSTMIRQTRRYFRYQSGKGIQVSFAVNFSPSTTIDTLYRDGNLATIVTRNPHRMSSGLNITVSGATVSSGNNYWNGVHQVTSIVDDYTFQFVLPDTPVDITADGLIEYYVNNWQNCLLKCGMFDDQNGLYFEYDGSTLYFCRRSSTQQISGTASVQFKSGEIIGNNTKFLSQLAVNQKIVIKGQTYLISKIVNNNLLYILPTYRGSDATNVIITKVVDTKIPQSQWNLDVCDGTGLTGYYLDIHKIQMAYMDYSWYGAGKVRFGFKDQRGKVIYAHEFIHNNKFTEAYMRSGNIPARYEIENLGTPSYVPALAHWGTSVIMDGKFDDDKAYVFSAPSNSLSITGSSSLSITGSVESTQPIYVFVGSRWQFAGYGITLATASPSYTVIPAGISVTGTNVSSLTANPASTAITPYQPYLPGVLSGFGSNFNPSSQSVRNLLLVRNVNGTSSSQTYTVALSSAASSVVYEQPLISIRLAPSVDNSTPGLLGEREIINRMQLILSSVGILTTHTCEVSLKLNGSLNTSDWQRVTNPSLSQLIYHGTSDRISGGTTIYTFRAGGSTGNTARILVNTLADLGEIATLGNSILGGNNPFPDGPDVLTVVAKLIEDPSNVSGSNPFNVSARISWSESQA